MKLATYHKSKAQKSAAFRKENYTLFAQWSTAQWTKALYFDLSLPTLSALHVMSKIDESCHGDGFVHHPPHYQGWNLTRPYMYYKIVQLKVGENVI